MCKNQKSNACTMISTLQLFNTKRKDTVGAEGLQGWLVSSDFPFLILNCIYRRPEISGKRMTSFPFLSWGSVSEGLAGGGALSNSAKGWEVGRTLLEATARSWGTPGLAGLGQAMRRFSGAPAPHRSWLGGRRGCWAGGPSQFNRSRPAAPSFDQFRD